MAIFGIIKEEFDGTISKSGFFTPFINLTISGSEVILWEPLNILERQIDDPLDSNYLITHKILPFNAEEIDFNEEWSRKNVNFKVVKFFEENKTLSNIEFAQN